MKTHLINFFFPPQCLGCKGKVLIFGDFCSDCWTKINFITDPFCQTCGTPLDFSQLNASFEKCLECNSISPSYNAIRSLCTYGEIIKKAILQFKHGDATYLRPIFSTWLIDRFKQEFLNSDLIVSVPLHWSRLFKRQYNQSTLMCVDIAKKLNLKSHYLPILARKRSAHTQGFMKRTERFENLKDAFYVKESFKNNVENKKIIIIDDVVTTGATIEECAKALLKEGAKEVNAITIARVLKDNY